MDAAEPFDLSTFLTESLSLQSNIAPQVKSMYPIKKPPTIYQRLSKQDPLDVLGEKSFGKPREIPESVVGTPIQEFYRGTNILITGGTGFLGKVVTEKLIRSIPHLGHIYLLIRAKRGKSFSERFEQLIEDQLFLRMRTEVPEYRSKITPINGDISEPGLGLTPADRKLLLEKVNIVVHSAAHVKFNAPLRVAVKLNVFGSQNTLNLAKDMMNLKAYVHVSTAFSQCTNRVIEEKIPKMSIHYKEVLHILETNTDEELEQEIPRIMQGWPNTYTFSKALCEIWLQEEAISLPVCVFRPSVVWSTYKEPARGWTDNLYGPTGFGLAVGLGVLHVASAEYDLGLDIVPVDYVVNCMIAAAWNLQIEKSGQLIPIYNFTSFPTTRINWKMLSNNSEGVFDLWPYSQMIWYPSLFFTSNKFLYSLSNTVLHKACGKVFDQLAVLAGEEPRLSKVYQRIDTLKPLVDYFVFTIFEFKNENVASLWQSLTEEDKEIFSFDIENIDYMDYLCIGKLGLRYYYLKEKMDNLPAAERKSRMLYWAHVSLQLASGFLLLKLMVALAHVIPL